MWRPPYKLYGGRHIILFGGRHLNELYGGRHIILSGGRHINLYGGRPLNGLYGGRHIILCSGRQIKLYGGRHVNWLCGGRQIKLYGGRHIICASNYYFMWHQSASVDSINKNVKIFMQMLGILLTVGALVGRYFISYKVCYSGTSGPNRFVKFVGGGAAFEFLRPTFKTII